MVIELLDERGDCRDDEFDLFWETYSPSALNRPLSLRCSSFNSPLKAVVTSVKDPMQMQQLSGISSVNNSLLLLK